MQQARVWKDTVRVLGGYPKKGSKSRIIVTTSIRSVATACSSGSYVYNMQCLKDGYQKRLFWRKVYGNQMPPPSSLADDPETKIFFEICGGLPLVLICAAKHLNMNGMDLKSRHCKELRRKLGRYLSDDNAPRDFKEMRRALMQCYDNLPDHDLRSFLLYLSIFPRGHQIKSKSLVRRLKAEGLIVDDEEPTECFDELIDRCIIEPVRTWDNLVAVKRGQIHGVVLEYISQKIKNKNVVTLVEGPEVPIGSHESSIRRLSIQYSINVGFIDLQIRPKLRSLTMFVKNELSNLQKCKMMRLLDLEGCTGRLESGFLKDICELPLLKYLSLRGTGIKNIPTQIENLKRLETLDVRETEVKNLPMQVIMLPKLAYLFGKFQLPEVGKVRNNLREFLQKKSSLHTLSGFIANETQCLAHAILLFATNLKKVKVWCSASSRSRQKRKSVWVSLPSSSANQMQGNHPCLTTEEGSRSVNLELATLLTRPSECLESVSIVSSSGLCKHFWASLEGRPCTISSIKLQGNLGSLPDSKKLSDLGRIKKLHLYSTGLTIEELSALQYLRGLEYLKLVELEHNSRFCNGTFVVEKNGFESLKSLCIKAPHVPKLQFKEGAMKSLTSIHLLCPNSQKLLLLPSETIVGISNLTYLSELIIHSSLPQDWERVADGHPNRPCVKREPEQTANTAT